MAWVFLKKMTVHIMCDITFVFKTSRDLMSWSEGNLQSLRVTAQADCLLSLPK